MNKKTKIYFLPQVLFTKLKLFILNSVIGTADELLVDASFQESDTGFCIELSVGRSSFDFQVDLFSHKNRILVMSPVLINLPVFVITNALKLVYAITFDTVMIWK